MAVGAAFFFQIVFNNGIEGGLKDIGHDGRAGARTLALRLGVSFRGRKLAIPRRFVALAAALRLFFWAAVGVMLFLQRTLDSTPSWILVGAALALSVGCQLAAMIRFLRSGLFARRRLRRLFGIHEMASYGMLAIALTPSTGFAAALIVLAVPALWYLGFNLLLYGSPLQPRV